MLTTIHKTQDGQRLVSHGYFTKQELRELKHEGWRRRPTNVNKHGIPVSFKGVK